MITTFGFKHGPAPSADRVYDVRDLPNPHDDPRLRSLDGRDPMVRSWVLTKRNGQGEAMVRRIVLWIRSRQSQGLSADVAIGCTGGRHRSVTVGEAVATLTGEPFTHRDL